MPYHEHGGLRDGAHLFHAAPWRWTLAEGTTLDTLLQLLTGMDGWAIYGVLALLVLGESTGVLALLLPGELSLMAAGALAATGRASLAAVLVITSVAAVVGHAVGYELGRRYGLRFLHRPTLQRYAAAVDRFAAMTTRHGGPAVFLGRWTNVGRVVVPLLVGAGRMRYSAFTLYNVLGGVAWTLTFVLLGTLAGASLDVLHRSVGQASTLATAVGLLAVVGIWTWRRTRRRRRGWQTDNGVRGGEVTCNVQTACRWRSDT